MFCIKCGSENPAGAEFCWKCGVQLFIPELSTGATSDSGLRTDSSGPSEVKAALGSTRPIGIGGWLALLCVVLGILTPVSWLLLTLRLLGGGITPVRIASAVIACGLAISSFSAALKLYRKDARGIEATKTYIVANVAAVSFVLTVMNSASLLPLLEATVAGTIWWLYLDESGWFAGGTITVASVSGRRFYFQPGPEAFEDGTLNFLSLSAVEIGLRHLQAIGLDSIHTRVRCLTEWLLGQLSALRHDSGAPLVRIYGPLDSTSRGGIVTLNVYDRNGDFVDHRLVERRANHARISLRTGCFCNPGDGELALGISAEELTTCFTRHEDRLTLDEFRRCIDAKSTGAVRISVGLATTFADAAACVAFARSFLDQTTQQIIESVS